MERNGNGMGIPLMFAIGMGVGNEIAYECEPFINGLNARAEVLRT